MGLKSYTKKTFKANTNVSGWVDLNSIKRNSQTIGQFYKDIKGQAETGPVETRTFDEAMKYYGLSEDDLRKKMKGHLQVALFAGALGAVALIWLIYLLTKGMYSSCIVALALAFLMFTYGFKEHFFYFKMKERRLDCTVSEWFSSFLRFLRK